MLNTGEIILGRGSTSLLYTGKYLFFIISIIDFIWCRLLKPIFLEHKNPWRHHDMRMLSTLLALCEGNPLATHKGPVMQSCDHIKMSAMPFWIHLHWRQKCVLLSCQYPYNTVPSAGQVLSRQGLVVLKTQMNSSMFTKYSDVFVISFWSFLTECWCVFVVELNKSLGWTNRWHPAKRALPAMLTHGR